MQYLNPRQTKVNGSERSNGNDDYLKLLFISYNISLFAKKVNIFSISLFQWQGFILDVLQCPKCTSGFIYPGH